MLKSISTELKTMLKQADSLRRYIYQTTSKIKSVSDELKYYTDYENTIYFSDILNFMDNDDLFESFSNEELDKERLNLIEKLKSFKKNVQIQMADKAFEQKSLLLKLQNDLSDLESKIKEQLEIENFKTYDDLTVDMYTISVSKIPNKITHLLRKYLNENNIYFLIHSNKLKFLSQTDIRDDIVKYFEDSETRSEFPKFYLKSYIQNYRCKIDQIKLFNQ